MRRQIGQLKERFRNQLQQIGIEVFDEDIDSLLMPVTQDDFVSMAAVVSNIAALTTQLEGLTEESKELPPQARRYYGMYLLLVYAIDRVQTRFIQEVDHLHLPRLHAFEEEARQNITEAKNQIASGGPKEQLRANIDAANTTIEACHCLASALRDQKNAIADENEQTKLMLDAAIITYKTVRLSLNVAELMSDCREGFPGIAGVALAPAEDVPKPATEVGDAAAGRANARSGGINGLVLQEIVSSAARGQDQYLEERAAPERRGSRCPGQHRHRRQNEDLRWRGTSSVSEDGNLRRQQQAQGKRQRLAGIHQRDVRRMSG